MRRAAHLPIGIDVASFIRNIHDKNINGAAAGILKQNIRRQLRASVRPKSCAKTPACAITTRKASREDRPAAALRHR
jgi:hypothetical protein